MTAVGVILAAGTASRMGRLKQALPFHGKSMLECVVDNALASSLDGIVVVLGYQADLLQPLVADRDVTVIINKDYRSGQSSSIRAAMEAVPPGTGAVLFLLGDQPLVAPATINLLLEAGRESAAPIVVPVFEGRRGNPVLFGCETFSRLKSVTGERGAGQLFEEYAGRILPLPVEDEAICLDVDTEEDYGRLLQT